MIVIFYKLFPFLFLLNLIIFKALLEEVGECGYDVRLLPFTNSMAWFAHRKGLRLERPKRKRQAKGREDRATRKLLSRSAC